MKKIKFLSLILATVAFVSPILSVTAFAWQQPSSTDEDLWYMIGDVKVDGTVDAADARLVLQMASYLAEKPDANTIRFYAADLDHDDQITVNDARLICRAAVGLDTLSQVKDPSLKDYDDLSEAYNDFADLVNQLKTNDGNINYHKTGTVETSSTTETCSVRCYDKSWGKYKDVTSDSDYKIWKDMESDLVSDSGETQTSKLYKGSFDNKMHIKTKTYVVEPSLADNLDVIKSASTYQKGTKKAFRITLNDQTIKSDDTTTKPYLNYFMANSENNDFASQITEAFSGLTDEGSSLDSLLTVDGPHITYTNCYVEYRYTEDENKVKTITGATYNTKVSIAMTMDFSKTMKAIVAAGKLADSSMKDYNLPDRITINVTMTTVEEYTFD